MKISDLIKQLKESKRYQYFPDEEDKEVRTFLSHRSELQIVTSKHIVELVDFTKDVREGDVMAEFVEDYIPDLSMIDDLEKTFCITMEKGINTSARSKK